jgi:alpha-tubulin suppressor-like RCC1 family protein
LTNWATPKAGIQHGMCNKTDGTIWTWGDNSVGQLGQNNTTDRSSPVQVGALTTWVVPLAGGSSVATYSSGGITS